MVMGRVMDGLSHAISRGGRLCDHNTNRVLHTGLCQAGQIGRHRGGEEEGLPLFRHGIQDLVDLGCKTHIEHAIGLIQHQDRHGKETDRAVPHVIEQSPRRGHDDIGTLPQTSDLRLHIGPAYQGGREQLEITPQGIDRRLNLNRQFPCRGENERAGLPLGRAAQPFQKRNHKGRRLACTCLGAAQHIPSREGMRNGLRLNGGRLGESRLGQIFQQGGRQTEGIKVR